MLLATRLAGSVSLPSVKAAAANLSLPVTTKYNFVCAGIVYLFKLVCVCVQKKLLPFLGKHMLPAPILCNVLRSNMYDPKLHKEFFFAQKRLLDKIYKLEP